MKINHWGHVSFASSCSLLARTEGGVLWLQRYEAAVLEGNKIAEQRRASGEWLTFSTRNMPHHLQQAQSKAGDMDRRNSIELGTSCLTWQQHLFCATEPRLALTLPGQRWHISDLRSLACLVMQNPKKSAEDIARSFLGQADAERKQAVDARRLASFSSQSSSYSSSRMSSPPSVAPPSLS